MVLAALAPPAPALQKDCINQNQKTGMSCVYGASTQYANSCLVDTSKTCVRGGVNHPTASKYCYGCVIYKSYCEPAQQQQTPPDFVVHRNKHSLVRDEGWGRAGGRCAPALGQPTASGARFGAQPIYL